MKIISTEIAARINCLRWIAGLALAISSTNQGVLAVQTPVNLGTAGNFAVLAKSGISTVPPSVVTGNIAVSPIDAAAITGFSLSLAAGSPFATSSQVAGEVYAPNYAAPTPARLTTAIGDMETAFTEAAGRSNPDFTELGAGQLGGLTLVPGLYKWGTDVLISSDVSFNGGPNDVWILQVAGKVTQANGVRIHLIGGATAANIFWQCSGAFSLGTTAYFEGIILAQTSINLQTGASVNGRLLAQTAVTLQANSVTQPTTSSLPLLVSSFMVTGPYSYSVGQSLDSESRTFKVAQSATRQFYRILSDSALTITSIAVSDNNVRIQYQ